MFVKEAQIQRDIKLFNDLYRNSWRIEKMPRKWRYTLGEDTQKCISDMGLAFDIGWVTTNTAKKLDMYETAAGVLLHIQHNLNDMNDENIIDNVTKAKLDIASDNIGRQLLGLANSIRQTLGGRASGSKTTGGETLD